MKILFVLFCTFVLFNSVYPNTFNQSAIFIRQIIDDIIEQRYEEAFQKAEQHKNNPHKLEFWTAKALIYHAMILDYESFEYNHLFFQASDSLVANANQFLNEPDLKPYVLLIKGTIEGLRSNVLQRQGKYLQAVSSAFAMKNYLTECIKLQPQLKDAYIGLGSFDYWSSKAIGYLPFFEDNRERGIKRLQEAEKNATIHPVVATTALIWINIDKKEFQVALEQSEKLLEKYPQSRALMWSAGEAAYQMKNWQKGIHYYEKILNSVKSSKGQSNHYNELGCYHRLIEMYLNLGNKTQAKHYLLQAKALKLSEEVKKRKKKDLKNIEQWAKELN